MISRLRQIAVKQLARRDYSCHELKQLLFKKQPDAKETEVDEVLQNLIDQKFLDDSRFVEIYIRSRRNRGYGPIRIAAELKEHRIDPKEYLDTADSIWLEHLIIVRQKRFGASLPTSPQEKARQIRFLQYRGFAVDMIMSSIAGL